MGNELWRLSATELAAKIARKEVTAREATESALTRMVESNPAVNAVTVNLSEQAIEAAQQADQIAASGVALGALHGVPITIKENVDQIGTSTSNGVPAFEAMVATEDAPVVANLKKAGAIVIGRTNTPEFSYRWFTDNPLRGRTKNPWRDDLTPGGSSGGAAASVALGIGAMAHGNDLGGSLRYPAYACGVATIRPTLGRIASYNATAPAERSILQQMMSVQGPIAREVRDVRLSLAVMAERDMRDPWWVPAPLRGPEPQRPIKVALTRGLQQIPSDPAVDAALNKAAEILSAAGYIVEERDPPLWEEVAETWRSLITTEIQVMGEAALKQFGSDDLNQVVGDLMSLSNIRDIEGYMTGMSERTRILRAWTTFLEEVPLVLAPVSQELPMAQKDDLSGPDRVREILGAQSVLYGINLLGLPSAAVPTGLHEGCPVGVQIIGQRFREDMCLDAAEVIENEVGVISRQLWER